MATYEITAEMNLKNVINESREIARVLYEFADNLERIEKKYAEPRKSKKGWVNFADDLICTMDETEKEG